MERQALKFKQLCVLSALLIVGAVANLFLFFASSQWGLIFDTKIEGHVPVPAVSMIGEWPVSDDTLQRLLNNQPIDSKTFRIEAFEGTQLGPQILQVLEELGVESKKNLNNVRYALFFDLDREALASVQRPYLYFHGSFAPVDVYINGKLVRSIDARITSLNPVQILGDTDKYRVVFVVRNSYDAIIAGPNFHTSGLIVQSEQALDQMLLIKPIQKQFPRIATTVCFIVFGLLSMALGFSAREYIDIWAYSSFCIAAGLYSWSFTPMFYMAHNDNFAMFRLYQSSFGTALTISAAILTLGYFRLEGRHFRLSEATGLQFTAVVKTLLSPFRAILAMTVLGCLINLLHFRPWDATINVATSNAAFNEHLVWILLGSQLGGFLVGFGSLFRLRRQLATSGLKAQVVLVNRRIMQAALFAVGMSMMVAIYGIGFSTINKITGNDLTIAGSIFPALIMLLMFLGMVSSGQRFYKKFTPRLGQIDHEVMAFGPDALEKRYHGVLMVFDVAGMKALNVMRLTHRSLETAIDTMIGQIEHDLSALVQNGRVTFKYKSNGDEFIFAIWAKDAADAGRQFVELMTAWRQRSAGLMAAWKGMLTDSMESAENRAVVEELDMHVMACTMNDIKITVKGGIDHPTAAPDFFEPRFTQLSALFKPSRWNKVAVFQDDAGLLAMTSAFFDAEKGMQMGFWEFEGADKMAVEKRAS